LKLAERRLLGVRGMRVDNVRGGKSIGCRGRVL
jgi:hypothetical protein